MLGVWRVALFGSLTGCQLLAGSMDAPLDAGRPSPGDGPRSDARGTGGAGPRDGGTAGSGGVGAADAGPSGATWRLGWAHGFGTGEAEWTASVFDDYDGDLLAGGAYSNGTRFIGDARSAIGTSDAWVAKLSQQGALRWLWTFGYADGINVITSVAEAPQRGVVAGGRVEGHFVAAGIADFTTRGADGLVLRFDPDGHLVWASPIGGDGKDSVRAVAVTSAGDVYAVGVFQGDLAFGPATISSGSPVVTSGFLAKLGRAGAPQWARVLGGGRGNDVPWSVAWDPQSGAVFVTGVAEGDPVRFGDLPIMGTTYGYLARFEPDGTATWAARFGTGAGTVPRSVHVRFGDDVIVAGQLEGELRVPGRAAVTADGMDGFLLSMSPVGPVAAWVQLYGGPGEQFLSSASGLGASTLSLGGCFTDGFVLGATMLSPAGGRDCFVASARAADGVPLDAFHFGGDGDEGDVTTPIHVSGREGHVFAGGAFGGDVHTGGLDLAWSQTPREPDGTARPRELDAFVLRLERPSP